MKLKERLILAAKEGKKLSSLTGVSMLLALNVVIYSTTTIVLSPTQQIGIYFITTAISGMLYGPWLTGMSGVVGDIIKYMIRPTGQFFPGFTLNEFVVGVIYGVFLYKKEITIPRAFAARLCSTVFVNLFLTPMWLSIMYGKGFIVLVSARLVKNIIMLPLETAMLYFVAKAVSVVRQKYFTH